MFFLGWKNGITMNPFLYEKNVIIAVFIRCLLAILNNYCVFRAVQLIPISKAIIIYSLVPFWSSIMGAVFLNENVNNLTIFCSLSSAGGIILLTLNKKKSRIEEGSYFGYILIMAGTLFTSASFIVLRYLSKYKVKMHMPTFMVGVSFLLQGIFSYIFFSNVVTADHYSTNDGVCLNVIGILSVAWLATMFYANKYAVTGIVTPIMNLENLFTILFDIFLFKYHFGTTDIFGMLVLVVWIGAPIVYKVLEYQKIV